MTESSVPDVGIDVGGQQFDLTELESQLEAGGVSVPNGLVVHGPPQEVSDPTQIRPFPAPYPQGTMLYTFDDQGQPADLPPGAEDIVKAYHS